MDTKKILKDHLSLAFVILIALFLSACGSSSTKSSTDDNTISYNGIRNPAAITKENAAEFSTKAIAVGFATDIEDSYSSALMTAVEPLSASSSKSIAKAINNDVVENSFKAFMDDIINYPGNPLVCLGNLDAIMKAIKDEDSAWRLYSGECNKVITFDDTSDTFTIVYTFTSAKIYKNTESNENIELVDLNGSVTRTMTFDYSDYLEPEAKASPVAEWTGMTDAEKYNWAIDNCGDYPRNKTTKACNGLIVTYTNKSDPPEDTVPDEDMFGEGYGGYDSYNHMESNSYQLNGDFNDTDTNTYTFVAEPPADEFRNSSITSNSTFNGFLKLVSGISDIKNNYKSDFELIATGESLFAIEMNLTETYTPEAPPLAKGTYENINFEANDNKTVRIHGNIDFSVKTTDDLTSESLVIQIRDGVFEDSDCFDMILTGAFDGDNDNLDDGEKYIYQSLDLTENETKTISGNATAKLDIMVHALDDAAQIVYFKLDSGSITFSEAKQEKTIIVKKVNADGEDTFVVEDSSMDRSIKSKTAYSGSASITHKEMLAALSGEYSVENILTIHDDNPNEFSGKENIGDHVDDIRTKSSKTSFNNMKFRTDFCDIGIQGSLSEERDLTADYYDANQSTYNLDMIINDNIKGEDYWFNNYLIGISREKTKKSVNNTKINASLTGRFHHSAYGYVDLSTIAWFSMTINPNMNILANEYDLNSSFPTTGKLLLTGAANSSATFSVFTDDDYPAGYTIKADTDGNGAIDFMSSETWPDIQAFQDNYWFYTVVSSLYNDYDYLILEIEDALD